MRDEVDLDPDEYARRLDEEYQTQLFGFTSRIMYNGAIQEVNEHIDKRCRNMFKSIEKKFPDDATKEILAKNYSDLNKIYRNNIQPHFKRLENVINKFICVPPNILLEEDKLQITQYNDDEFRKLEEQLENLQQQAKRATVFKAALKHELETIKNIKESEELAKKLCSITEKVLSTKKLSNKVVRAIEKNKEVKELLETINPQNEKDIFNPRIDECELNEIILDTSNNCMCK